MNIVQICTSDLRHGAGMAAYRLHKAYKALGHHAKLIVAEKYSDDEDVSIPRTYPFGHQIIELFLNLFGQQGVYSYLSKNLAEHPLIQKADVIHLHNIHWPFKNFSLNLLKLGKTKPLFWTLHDMWPITGHCYHSFECTRWETGCGKCPHLRTFLPLGFDTSHYQWNLKKKLYAECKPNIIAPSKWLYDITTKSPLANESKVFHIPNAIDCNIFKPQDKQEARKTLGLDPNSKVLLFISAKINLSIKGLSYFEEAISKIKYPLKDIIFLTVGKGEIPTQIKNKIKTKELGVIRDEQAMAQIYCAADITLVPSVAENLPYVALESLTCGTPIVGFDIGGLQDLVKHQKTGYLAKCYSSEDLANGVDFFLNNQNISETASRETAQITKDSFSAESVANKHLMLFKESL